MSAFGILNVNKPPGITSRDVVNRVQSLLPGVKAGHAGTLDPLASGVLVVGVGPATRLVPYVQQLRKHYRATFLLGRRSESDDIESPVHEIADAQPPERDHLERAAEALVGKIQQRPPAFSAVKVAGRRAYDRARRGESFDLAEREVEVHSLDVAQYDYPRLELAIECGSGTYVRSLGRDLAAACSTGAVMSELVRTAVGPFAIESAVPLAELMQANIAAQLVGAEEALVGMERVTLGEQQANEIAHGREIVIDPPPAGRELAALDQDGSLIAILGNQGEGRFRAKRNFPRS